MVSDDGEQLQGWITSNNVLQAVARHIRAAQASADKPQAAGEPALPGPQDDHHSAPTPLGGYQVLEITIPAAPASHTLGDITWPPGYLPVSVQDARTLRDPDPSITLRPGDRVSLLARTRHNTQPPSGEQAADTQPARQAPGLQGHDQRARPAETPDTGGPHLPE